MKNIILIQIIILFISSCSVSQNQDLTGQEIWVKYLETFGKKDNLLKIKTFSYISDTESEFGNIKAKMILKYPDKIFNEITYSNGAVVTYILNGEKGIVKAPNGNEDLSNDIILSMKNMALIFPELYYIELGYEIKLKGQKDLGKKSFYIITVKTDIETFEYIIDKSNFQIFQLVAGNSVSEYEETAIFEDVRVVKKLIYISEKNKMITRYSNYRINDKVDDDIFEIN